MNLNIFQWRSLKTKVTLFTLAIFLISIWSLEFYVSRMLREDMQRLLGDQQFSTVSFIAAEVNEKLNDRLRALENVAVIISPAILDNTSVLQTFLEQRFTLQGLFNGGITVLNLEGTAVADFPLSAGRVGINYLDSEAPAAALGEGKSTIGRPIAGKTPTAPAIVMAVPIRDAEGKVIGALAGTTNLGMPNFLDKITTSRYGKTGGYLLVAPQNRSVVTATDKIRLTEALPAPGTTPPIEHLIQSYEGSAIFVNALGVEILVSDKGVPAAGWIMSVVLPTEEAFAPIRAMQQRVIFATLLLSLLAGTLTWWMLRHQLDPLLSAVRNLAALSNADRPLHPLSIARQDEIGQLIGGFNHLLKSLAQREYALKEALNRLQKIASQVPGVVFQIRMRDDGSTCVPYASDALRKIYRINPDEIRDDASPAFAVVHPDDLPEHLASLEASARYLTPWHNEYRLKFEGEADIWLLGNAIPQQEEDGSVLWHGFVTDITERKEAEACISHLAHHDALTGLHNRLSLNERLEQSLATAQRDQRPLAVMFLDMDRFKTINDTLGHGTGDRLLVEVAHRLGEIVRNSDIVARLGGDEFVIVLTEVESATSAARVAEKILTSLGQSYFIDGYEVHSSPSIGLAIYPDDGEDSEALMKNADTAMYHAKSQGRNNVQFFAREMNLVAMRRLHIEHDMREALATKQFELQYQPQLEGRTGRFVGVEALLRWRNPQHGLVSAAAFMQVAEETGLILPLGEWVLDEACRQLRAWRDQGVSDISVAVNLSAHQLRSPTLLRFVALTLEKYDLTGPDLGLEITESSVMDDPEACIHKLKSLRNMGVKLSIDDFGTGYSSLSYLKQMPIHTMKVDKSFVHEIETDINNVVICTATIELAHNLGLTVLAEGVETEAQCDFLIAHHCDFMQGFLFSKPLDADSMLAFFTQQTASAPSRFQQAPHRP